MVTNRTTPRQVSLFDRELSLLHGELRDLTPKVRREKLETDPVKVTASQWKLVGDLLRQAMETEREDHADRYTAAGL